MLSPMPARPADDWYVLIAGLEWPGHPGRVRYRVTLYHPGHQAFQSREFLNPVQANAWADSWGLPRSLTQHV